MWRLQLLCRLLLLDIVQQHLLHVCHHVTISTEFTSYTVGRAIEDPYILRLH